MGVSSRPGYTQKYLSFPDVARNKRHAPRVPSNVGCGQFKFGADPIRRYGDIRGRAETGSRGSVGWKSCRRGRSTEATTVYLSTSMDSACASQFSGDWTRRPGDPFLHTTTCTHRQTTQYSTYIYIVYRQLNTVHIYSICLDYYNIN